MKTCSYCRGPIRGRGPLGRPFPNQAPAEYCCYGCLSLGEQQRYEAQAKAPPTNGAAGGLGLRLGAGILIAGQSMTFSLAVNLSGDLPDAVRIFLQGSILAATMLVVALLGGPLLRNAVAEAQRGRITLEALFLLTLTGALTASVQAFVTGTGKIYFEVVSILLVVYTIGKLITAKSRAAALRSTRLWAESLAQCRLVDEKGRTRFIETTTLQPGDLVEVHAGEAIPLDGVIRSGVGYVSEAAVSGEPFAVVRRPGDRVTAGSISYDATFRIEAERPGNARRIDELLAVVEAARSLPITFQGQADRLSRVFVPFIVLVAAATFGLWTMQDSWEVGLFHAMSVLLVACPCALGLATPIVVWSALARLAERGLIVRTPDALERLGTIDRVVFDKTGTLTDDQFAILDIATQADGAAREQILNLLALVEAQSTHPLAKPFAKLPRIEDGSIVQEVRTIPGCGIEAHVVTGGRPRLVRIGRPEWLRSSESPEEARLLDQLLATSGHRIDMTIDGELTAIALVRERLRDSAGETLRDLARLRIDCEVLTGDSDARTQALGLNIPATANLLPQEKRQRIATMQANGRRVLMVGDGINDAAALAEAEASIALSGGTDLANAAADATLYHDDLRVLPWALTLAREATATIRRNLLRATGYNLVGIALAASGTLHPVTAALLMTASSLLLIWSASQVGIPADERPCDDDPAASVGTRPSPEPATVLAEPIPGAEQKASASPASGTGLREHYLTQGKALAHFAAVVGQGIVAVQLVPLDESLQVAVVGAFGLFGGLLTLLWYLWRTQPANVDMAIGMLTLGNLGMLVGWWADNRFEPLRDAGCCQCVEAMRAGILQPWMWLLMLVGANLAMLGLARRSHAGLRFHIPAMYSGGNLGMVLGMLAGGAAGLHVGDSVPLSALTAFLGMSVGMILGMIAGSELTRRLLKKTAELRRLPAWLLREPTELSIG